jgi:hypothetical protein
MRIKSIATIITALLVAGSVTVTALSASRANATSVHESVEQMSSGSIVLSTGGTLTPTAYLPIIFVPRPPLFVGMTLRWDSSGYGRGSEVWDAGYHLTRNLDTMTDADTIRSNNYAWYSPNPFNWPDETWYSYYSISTLEFKASSVPPNPDWKWAGAYWILPYGISISNGAVVTINGQPFIVSGPYDGYTAFGKAVRYWQLTNRDKFLLWDNGGDWRLYVHPGEITIRYDAGSTRLLLYYNGLRHWYYRGSLTSDTIQWIDILTSTNAWPTAQGARLESDSPFPLLPETEVGLEVGRESRGRPVTR